MSTSGLARSSHVTCQCVRFVTFKRPEKQNTRSWQLLDEFLAELKRASADPAVKAIVISGNGTFFSAGADLKRHCRPGPRRCPKLEHAPASMDQR
ncbi:hypothetical protein ED733_004659 [Metarhizium rileyi]|uniref:Enoyl-CoA hydratase/isomerase family protein n=1 Tax=Metarhizium rileyi (strain RCEF 4871) TaxID=1649241 RepID=A0A5C6GHA0_METRR|nr:hypothetical protein ED733_004659 [Metarhizium rileyi]